VISHPAGPRPAWVAADGVDLRSVPARRLRGGATMPGIGLGTFGSERVPHEAVAEAVLGAAEVGYRHFDCAAVYGNEAFVGRSLREIMARGVPREELFVTSKLWNDRHAPRDVRPAFERSLRDLGLGYVDLYLVHWPFPNHHPPGVDVHARAPDARPYRHDEYLATWRELEILVDEGLARHIGTSNMTIPKLELLLRDARIPPAANQMELHPHFQQPALFRYLLANGIQPVGFAPIGSPARPDRDRTPDDTVDVEDPVIVSIARRLGIHPAAVCVKWAVQRGGVPIPFSTRRANYLANIRAVVDEPLTADDIHAIAALDRNSRLIKGQVFLWREGQSWTDLWDPDGRIVAS